MNRFIYHVYEEVYQSIKLGTKKIEIRIYNEKSSKIKVGDTISFSVINDEDKNIDVRVTSLIIYKDVNDLLERYDSKMSTKTFNEENMIEGLYNIFGKEKVDNSKFIGIYFEKINMDDLLISKTVNKEPYFKRITNDNIINITGESGSGKSTYTSKYLNDDKYIVIDTDEIIKDVPTNNKNCIEFRNYLKDKYDDNIPDIILHFDIIYKEILDYYKASNKILVIDSAQYRNLKKEDMNILKGNIIVIRTCVDECYKRVIKRWKEINKNYTREELEKYKKRKFKMYSWYEYLNEFIKNVDAM